MKQSDGETTWRPGQGTQSGWSAGSQRTSGPLRNPASTSGPLRNPALTSGPGSQASAAIPASTPGRTASPAASLSGRLPLDTASQRALRAGRPGEWSETEAEDDPEGVVTFRQEYARAEAAAAPDPVSIGLVRVVLFLVACVAAYSLQSHSRQHYVPGTVSGGQVAQISYDAGWPLTYAHVSVGATSVPLADVEPTPAFRLVNPALLAVDVLLLALPLWVLLECLWALWVSILRRYGPRPLLRRLVALGFAALPALLWVLAGLGVGLISVYGQIDVSTLPKYVLPVLAPLLPGFGLALGAVAVLSLPPDLWRLDIGLYLLSLFFPLLLLTALFYVYGCVIGRAFRRLFKRR
jgi:hypothetical protein